MLSGKMESEDLSEEEGVRSRKGLVDSERNILSASESRKVLSITADFYNLYIQSFQILYIED